MNKKTTFKSVSRLLIYVTFSLYFICVLYLIRFNPDPHHDGILLSSGSATNRGLIPHKDYIFIWGPLLPYLLGLPMNLGINLINLRVFGYLCIVLLAYLAYLVNYDAKIHSKKQARLISLTWLIAYPAFSINNEEKWPLAATAWPNIYGYIMVLVSLFIINKLPAKHPKNYLLFAAGVFALSTMFIRINFVILYLCLILYIFLKYKLRKELMAFISPGMITIILVYCYKSSLFISNWYQQTFKSLEYRGSQSGVPQFTTNGIVRGLLAIILLAILYWIVVSLFNNIHKKRIIYSLAFTLLILGNLLFLTIHNGIQEISPLDRFIPWSNKINSEFSLGFIAFALVIMIPGTYFLHIKNKFNIQNESKNVLMAMLSFTSLFLNHNINIDYIWLNSIFVISYAAIILNELTNINLNSVFFPSLVSSFVIMFHGVFVVSQMDTYDFTRDPLKHMKTNSVSFGKDLDSEIGLIDGIPLGSNFQNLCSDSLYAANNRLVIKNNSLSYTDVPVYSQRMIPLPDTWIFLCDVNANDLHSLKYQDLRSYKKSNGSYSLVYKSVNK